MDTASQAVGFFLRPLKRFAREVGDLWNAYQQHGRVDSALFGCVDAAWEALVQILVDDRVVLRVAETMGVDPHWWEFDLRRCTDVW